MPPNPLLHAEVNPSICRSCCSICSSNGSLAAATFARGGDFDCFSDGDRRVDLAVLSYTVGQVFLKALDGFQNRSGVGFERHIIRRDS